MKVSNVIPVYNAKPYLERCVMSFNLSIRALFAFEESDLGYCYLRTD